MTRHFVVISVVLIIIGVTVECLPESADDTESLPTQRDDNEIPDTDDIARMGSAHAKAYASITQIRPGGGPGPLTKFVSCYSCVDCPKALANTTSKYCPYTRDPSKNNKCVVYAEKYTHGGLCPLPTPKGKRQMNKLWYIRGCATERGSCAEIKKVHDNSPSVTLSFCAECDGDRCNINGVSRSTFDLTTAIFVLVISPILGKYTLT